MKEVTIVLTEKDAEIIRVALLELPGKLMLETYQKLNTQVCEQLSKLDTP